VLSDGIGDPVEIQLLWVALGKNKAWPVHRGASPARVLVVNSHLP
jgi:hypothetical protein